MREEVPSTKVIVAATVSISKHGRAECPRHRSEAQPEE